VITPHVMVPERVWPVDPKKTVAVIEIPLPDKATPVPVTVPWSVMGLMTPLQGEPLKRTVKAVPV
jgi:hypothetical protein